MTASLLTRLRLILRNLPQSRRRLWGAGWTVFLLWLVASWLIASQIHAYRVGELVRSETADVEHDADNLSDNIAAHLEHLHGITAVVADEREVRGVLSRFGVGVPPTLLSPEKQKVLWSGDKQIQGLSQRLATISSALGADVVFVMNTSGDCVASSNIDRRDSFIGANYGDREYFRDAMSRKRGQQYAVGKISNIPGLYFSAPVMQDGVVIGVVAVKVNLPSLAHWVNQTSAFVTDDYGVIILSSDKDFEMHALQGATVAGLSVPDRKARYRREDFSELSITACQDHPAASMLRVEGKEAPLLLVSKSLERGKINTHYFRRLNDLVNIDREKYFHFVMLALAGGLALLFIGARMLYLRERDANERRIRESEQRYRFLFDNNPMPMFVLAEVSLQFLEVNDRAVEHYGYTREEFGSMTIRDIRPADEAPQFSQMRSSSTSGVVVGEYCHRKKDGTTINVSISTLPMDYDGTPARIVLIHDITLRKQAEAALQRQLQYAHALNVIADTVVGENESAKILENTVQTVGRTLASDRSLIYDISFTKHQAIGLCEWLNPECASATPTKASYPLDVFIGAATELRRTHQPLVSHADNVDAYLHSDGADEILHHQMQIRSLLWYPFAFRHDGYYLLVLNQIQSRREWAREEIEFLDSVSHGVNVALEKIRLLAERERVENDLRIAATAFEAKEGMMITDSQGVILRVNSAFTQITGYAAEEVVGQTPRVLHSGRHDDLFYAAMWQSVKTRGSWEGEIWNQRKDGSVYPENLIITVVRDKSGRLINYVGTFSDITQSKAAADEIKNLAFFDPLTGLPNRRLLMDRLQQAIASSTRTGREGAILFIDLDNFKTLNDTLGHDMGDLLLQQVAQRLGTCVREGDTVARLGGDEFVVMLEELSVHRLEAAAQTRQVGEKILALLNQSYQLQEREYLSTPSIGVALFSGHQTGVEELFKQADIAMYQAKKAGRNTLRFFDPEMQSSINARVAMEQELRVALDEGQLSLYYQVQVNEQRVPIGAEALIRWIHPERGMVSPAQFIPLAEETGMILAVGQWVVDTACARLKDWQLQETTRNLVLSVNVSARQFRQANFVEQVTAAVRRNGIDPALLKLELTESLLLEDVSSVIQTMSALNEMGIRFSLDDFGTGYSSLQYLKQLPLDQLKIDQSFTRDIVVDNSDRAIVLTIVAMAQSLHLDVIAEGVETEEQRRMLLSKGCRHYQGYLFGRPLPVEQFEQSLRSA